MKSKNKIVINQGEIKSSITQKLTPFDGIENPQWLNPKSVRWKTPFNQLEPVCQQSW